MELTIKGVFLAFNMEPLQDIDLSVLGGGELLYTPEMSIWMLQKERTACLYSITGHNLKQDIIVEPQL